MAISQCSEAEAQAHHAHLIPGSYMSAVKTIATAYKLVLNLNETVSSQ